MTKTTWTAFAISAALLVSTGARAQTCPGDCNGDQKVPVSELILLTAIAGGQAPVDDCTAGNVNGTPGIQIDELVMAVISSLSICDTIPLPTPTPTSAVVASPTPTTGPAVCGNGVTEGDEECDDGATCVGENTTTRKACEDQSDCSSGETCRAQGGDGCASNCTNEVRRVANLKPCDTPLQLVGPRDCAAANLSAQFLTNIELPLRGSQALTSGTEREGPWTSLDGATNDPLKIPIVIKAKDVQFEPVNVFGLFCACVVPVPVPSFGLGLENGQPVGISGSGLLGCNDEGLTDINFLIEQDHNTTPGDPGNSGSAMGLPDDPECDDVSDLGEGFTSVACKEGVGEACNGDSFIHVGSPTQACNSPRRFTFSGGPAGRGSVLLRNNTALKLLAGNPPDACVLENGEQCPPTFGPDCMPCTDDDVPDEVPVANNTPTTSGIAEVKIYDFRDLLPKESGPGVTMDNGSPLCPPPGIGCVNKVEGTPTDCDALLADPESPLTGVLATAFPGIDTMTTGDGVTTTSLASQQ